MKEYDVINQNNKSRQTTQSKETEKLLKKKVFHRNISIVVLIIIIIILLFWKGCGCNSHREEIAEQTVQEEIFEPIFEENGIHSTEQTEEKPKEIHKLVFQENIVHTQTEPEEKEKFYVTMPVIDNFTVSSKNPYAILYSPAENKEKFYITYTFTDAEGNIIYQSNPAEGGSLWEVNFKELLYNGEHTVSIQLSSIFCDTGKPANGVKSNITITVMD